MFQTGLDEKDLNDLRAEVSAKLDERKVLNPEHRIVCLLFVCWEDAKERGVGPARLATMAMGAWARFTEAPPTGGDSGS